MATYPKPTLHNGEYNSIFNNNDYIISPSSGTSQTFNDARYLKNNGVVVSSADTTFNGILNSNSLATFSDINVTGILDSAKSTDSLNTSEIFTTDMTFSIDNGMVYYLSTNSTVMTTLSFTDISTTPQKSFIFTFIMKPNTASSAFYIKPNTNFISVNGLSVSLSGLANVSLPSSYTYLVQQLSILNISTTLTPSYIALTSVSAY